MAFFNSKNCYREKANAPSSTISRARDVPPDDVPENETNSVSLSAMETASIDVEESSPVINVEAVIEDTVAPSTEANTISLDDHLHQHGLQIRADAIHTESGNCWYVFVFSPFFLLEINMEN